MRSLSFELGRQGPQHRGPQLEPCARRRARVGADAECRRQCLWLARPARVLLRFLRSHLLWLRVALGHRPRRSWLWIAAARKSPPASERRRRAHLSRRPPKGPGRALGFRRGQEVMGTQVAPLPGGKNCSLEPEVRRMAAVGLSLRPGRLTECMHVGACGVQSIGAVKWMRGSWLKTVGRGCKLRYVGSACNRSWLEFAQLGAQRSPG